MQFARFDCFAALSAGRIDCKCAVDEVSLPLQIPSFASLSLLPSRHSLRSPLPTPSNTPWQGTDQSGHLPSPSLDSVDSVPSGEEQSVQSPSNHQANSNSNSSRSLPPNRLRALLQHPFLNSLLSNPHPARPTLRPRPPRPRPPKMLLLLLLVRTRPSPPRPHLSPILRQQNLHPSPSARLLAPCRRRRRRTRLRVRVQSRRQPLLAPRL